MNHNFYRGKQHFVFWILRGHYCSKDICNQIFFFIFLVKLSSKIWKYCSTPFLRFIYGKVITAQSAFSVKDIIKKLYNGCLPAIVRPSNNGNIIFHIYCCFQSLSKPGYMNCFNFHLYSLHTVDQDLCLFYRILRLQIF